MHEERHYTKAFFIIISVPEGYVPPPPIGLLVPLPDGDDTVPPVEPADDS